MARILMPLPDNDFDITEVAVSWRVLSDAGHVVAFATEAGGARPAADPLLRTGVLFGQLGAAPAALEALSELEQDAAFQAPVSWKGLAAANFDGMVLPGGHAQGMRQYLDATEVHGLVAGMFGLDRPVGAICHGVIAAARAIDPATGKSVLAGYKTTCLPFYMERIAYFATAWRHGRYYRTYDAYVETEVRAALDNGAVQFERGPITLFRKGTAEDDAGTFVVVDRRYVSGRWPGDAYRFARAFAALL